MSGVSLIQNGFYIHVTNSTTQQAVREGKPRGRRGLTELNSILQWVLLLEQLVLSLWINKGFNFPWTSGCLSSPALNSAPQKQRLTEKAAHSVKLYKELTGRVCSKLISLAAIQCQELSSFWCKLWFSWLTRQVQDPAASVAQRDLLSHCLSHDLGLRQGSAGCIDLSLLIIHLGVMASTASWPALRPEAGMFYSGYHKGNLMSIRKTYQVWVLIILIWKD